MRQLLNVRFVAALAAVVLLALAVDSIFGEPDQTGTVVIEGGLSYDDDGEVITRRIDLIESVVEFSVSDDFEIGSDGLSVGVLDATLAGGRVMRVAPGTPGEVGCNNLNGTDRCAVFADLIGDAVIWFAVLPKAPRETVALGPIIDLQDGYAQFENGWEILYPPTIERDDDTCGDFDIPSFSDFLRRFGPDSTSIVDLETQQVNRVLCGEEVTATG